MRIELTDQEAGIVLEFVDCALGVYKLKALGAANMLVNKINAARIQEKNEKENPDHSNTPLNPLNPRNGSSPVPFSEEVGLRSS
jgi:hypothetical protein